MRYMSFSKGMDLYTCILQLSRVMIVKALEKCLVSVLTRGVRMIQLEPFLTPLRI